MQDELDRLAALLGRSVTVDDPAGRLLAHSVQSDDADRARIATILSRRVPDDVRAWQDQHDVSTALDPLRLPANPELGMSARLCVPLRDRHVLRAHLWVVEGARPLGPTEVAQAVQAGEQLVTSLPATRPGDDLPALLARLAAPAPPAEAERLLGSMAAACPALLGARVRFLVGVPGRDGAAATGTSQRRLAALARPDGGLVVGAVGPSAVTVLWLGPGRSEVAVREVLTSAGYVVGSGPTVPFEAGAVLRGLAEAVLTATSAAVDPRLGPDVTWERLGPYRQLLDPAAVATWRETLAPLSAGDASAAMLLDTLETYLDLAGDAQRTAAELSLHRTTLYYRLNRAADRLDGDLRDGLWRTSVHLALKARRLSGATGGA